MPVVWSDLSFLRAVCNASPLRERTEGKKGRTDRRAGRHAEGMEEGRKKWVGVDVDVPAVWCGVV